MTTQPTQRSHYKKLRACSTYLLNTSNNSFEAGTLQIANSGGNQVLRAEEVEAYKQRRDAERNVHLDELTALTEEFGGYPELEQTMNEKKLHCDMQGVDSPCPATDNEFYSVASVQRPLCHKHAAELAGRGISVFRIEDGETTTNNEP